MFVTKRFTTDLECSQDNGPKRRLDSAARVVETEMIILVMDGERWNVDGAVCVGMQ